jgi:type III secretory pathway component EscS
MIVYRDRLKTLISNTPGASGDFVISTAPSGYITFGSGDNALTFDVVIIEGFNWEIRKDCTYTHSGTTLSRGTLASSSTGLSISFTSAAIIAVTQISDRTIPFTINSLLTNDVLLYNGTNWVNSPLALIPTQTGHADQFLKTDGSTLSWSTVSSSVNLVSYSLYGGF